MAELIYLYALIPNQKGYEVKLPILKGFDGQHEIFSLPINHMVAIACKLDENVYSEEAIKEKASHDMEWLQEKAFHHHEALMVLNERYTVIPMKFCTLFASEHNLRETIRNNEEKLTNSFALIDGNEEWSLKIYSHDEQLKKHVETHNTEIAAKWKDLSKLSPGRQYFERKKIEKQIDQELEKEKTRICEGVHERLKCLGIRSTLKKNWDKTVTGRKENMCWNSVYLVPTDKVSDFLDESNHVKNELAGSGWKIESSGPWPAYHFAGLT